MNTHRKSEITRLQFHRIDEFQHELLGELENLLHNLETRVPLPERKGMSECYVYVDPSAQQICVAAFARLISSLHAQRSLLKAGLVQDLEICGDVFNEVARHARIHIQAAAERLHDSTKASDIRHDRAWQSPDHLMSIYMGPGPQFHVKGVVASAVWYERYCDVLGRHHELIELFSQAAVYFGQPGMHQYVERCGSHFLRRVGAMNMLKEAVAG